MKGDLAEFQGVETTISSTGRTVPSQSCLTTRERQQGNLYRGDDGGVDGL